MHLVRPVAPGSTSRRDKPPASAPTLLQVPSGNLMTEEGLRTRESTAPQGPSHLHRHSLEARPCQGCRRVGEKGAALDQEPVWQSSCRLPACSKASAQPIAQHLQELIICALPAARALLPLHRPSSGQAGAARWACQAPS